MKNIVTAVLIIAASGCTTLDSTSVLSNSSKQTLSAPGWRTMSSEEIFQAASKEYEQAFQANNPFKLQKATIMLEAIYQRHPENILIQDRYYSAMFMRDYTFGGKPTNKIIELFQNLNPLLKENFNPPSYIHILSAQDNNSSAPQILKLAKQSIADQPYSAASWNALSEAYVGTEDYWLAVAASKRALEIEPESAQYLLQYGNSVDFVASASDCVYDQRDYLSHSVKATAKASRQLENAFAYELTGLQYMRLGLLPLAYQNYKQGLALEKSPWMLGSYTEALIVMGRYDEAADTLSHAELTEYDEVNEYHAMMTIAANHHNNGTQRFLNGHTEETNALWLARWHWVNSLISGVSEVPNFSLSTSDTEWEGRIKQFLKNDITHKELLDDANSGCEKTEANFYVAYDFWRKANVPLALEYLETAASQNATTYYEKMWAPILKGELSKL